MRSLFLGRSKCFNSVLALKSTLRGQIKDFFEALEMQLNYSHIIQREVGSLI